MSAPLTIRVSENQLPRFEADCSGPVVLGRDRGQGGDAPGRATPDAGGTRFVIASKNETAVGRFQARLEPLAGDRLRVTNLHDRVPIGLEVGPALPPGGTCELPLPAVLVIGPKVVRVQLTEPPDEREDLASLAVATV